MEDVVVFKARGAEGSFHHASYLAARFVRWDLVAKQASLGEIQVNITGRLLDVHVYWFQQQPLTLILHVGRERWRWRAGLVVGESVPAQVTVVVSGLPEITIEGVSA